MKNIVVFGADGFTGSLISEKLINANIPFYPAIRKTDNFKKLFPDFSGKILFADLDIDDSIKQIINKADIFVNCVGPYNLRGDEVLKHVIEKKGLVYIDLTGEQEFVLNSYKKYKKIAFDNQVTILHSVAYESFLAVLLASVFLDKDNHYQEISSYYFSNNGVLSGGSRFTMKLRSFYNTYCFQNQELKKCEPFSSSRILDKEYVPQEQRAYFVPYPEVIFLPKSLNVDNVYTFQVFDQMFEITSSNSNETNLSEIAELEANRKRIYVKEKFRQREHFYFLLQARVKNGKIKEILAEGYDTYGFTAELVVILIKKIIESKNKIYGVINPASVVDAEKFLDNLKDSIKIL